MNHFYPAQSTPLLMVYDGKSFTVRDVAQMGFVMTFLLIATLITSILPYWNWLPIVQ
ncbi:hypothetical protein [Pueribacillus theae]|uniref:hypothetical protein n=1 Tax=Pueribacillus theae TaxID=2171751 RepID=UPI001402E39F|nr:hypothetical protein [Pueribacillus theae]